MQHAGDGDAVVQQVVVLQPHGSGVAAVPGECGATGRARSYGMSGVSSALLSIVRRKSFESRL